MTDNLTPEQRRKNMQNIHSEKTTPELKLINELKKQNLKFETNVKDIEGKPDIIFRKNKIAIFVDSDFWHKNPEKFIMPKSNLNYWKKKIKRNAERDIEVTKKLMKEDWFVLRYWESRIKNDFKTIAQEIKTLVNSEIKRFKV